MKSEIIMITSQGLGIQESLSMTEAIGAESELTRKEKLHLRLLAEELLGMLRSVAGEVEADYWILREGKSFELHMKSEVNLTEKMRQQLISASSSGENAAAKGIMGKIRLLIEEAFISRASGSVFANGLAMSFMSAASASGHSAGADAYLWSLKNYKEEVANEGEKASEAWDELEKSIVANIADEISVRIMGANVEIVIYKAF